MGQKHRLHGNSLWVSEKLWHLRATLHSAECLKPASGMDAWVSKLIGKIAMAGAMKLGAAACVGSGGTTCTVIAGTTIEMLKANEMFQKQVIKLVDQHFSSIDNLHIEGHGTGKNGDGDSAQWPKKGHSNVEQGDTIKPNISIDIGTSGSFCLHECDWFSGDDNVGCVDAKALEPGHNVILLGSETEGSVCLLEIHVR